MSNESIKQNRRKISFEGNEKEEKNEGHANEENNVRKIRMSC